MAATRDRLDLYWKLLGPHAAELEGRVASLSSRMAGRDPAWFRGQRSRLGDPFGELEGIVKRAAGACSSRASLEREIRDWLEDNRDPAVALFALDRAEHHGEDAAEPAVFGDRSVAERIEERVAVLGFELADLPPPQLEQRAAEHARDFDQRRFDLRSEARRIEEQRDALGPRTGVREARRFHQAITDVRGRWIDLHAEQAALAIRGFGLTSERSCDSVI